MIRVHPIVFHRALDLLNASGWQVRQEPDGIHVVIQTPEQKLDSSAIGASVAESLAAAGATLGRLRVEAVREIPTGPSGKRPLVVALKKAGC